MFTGIIQSIGKIQSVTPFKEGPDSGVHLNVSVDSQLIQSLDIGDSIAINGACMTVTSKDKTTFSVDVSRESLNHTTGLDTCGEVNLERALALGDTLGGHLVSGHVDGVGIVKSFSPVAESMKLVIQAPKMLAKYLAYKGSVAINGVSLTVNAIEDSDTACQFSINLIPHTVLATTLKYLKPDMRVNLEIDLIARYVERMLNADKSL